jgi:hypothetical protein
MKMKGEFCDDQSEARVAWSSPDQKADCGIFKRSESGNEVTGRERRNEVTGRERRGAQAVSDWVRREKVIEILKRHGEVAAIDDVLKLFSFPDPNPLCLEIAQGRNVMGQTEAEFWDKVERSGEK